MGLFRHEDDYVSPFEDGLPSYIDPFERAEYLSGIVETKQQMRDLAEQRAKEWASASRKPAKSGSSAARGRDDRSGRDGRSNQSGSTPTKRPASHHGGSGRAANANVTSSSRSSFRKPNPVVARQSAKQPRKKRHGFVWVVIVCAVVWGLAGPLFDGGSDWFSSFGRSWQALVADGGEGSSGGDAAADDGSSDDTADGTAGAPATVERTGDILDGSGDGKGTVTIASAESGPTDYYGRSTVIVSYEWTNTSDKPLTFDALAWPEVYQNGLQTNQITFSRDRDVPGYDADSMQTDVAPGGSLTTTLAYSLRDETTPIYVQSDRDARYSVSPLVVSGFTPNSDGTWTQVDSDSIPAAPQATDGDRRGMTTIGSDEYDTVTLRLAGARRGPASDIDDGPTAIVSVDWINESNVSDALSSYGKVEIKQNGVQLENAYYMDLPDGFVDNGYLLNVRPGLKTTVDYAVVLRDEDSPITVTFTPYDEKSSPMTQTFTLG